MSAIWAEGPPKDVSPTPAQVRASSPHPAGAGVGVSETLIRISPTGRRPHGDAARS